MKFESLLPTEISFTSVLGLGLLTTSIAALSYYLGRQSGLSDGVTLATTTSLVGELDARVHVKPSELKEVVDLFLARQRRVSGWRPCFMSGTTAGTGFYQSIFKPSLNGAAAYVFCRKAEKTYVLLNVQSREGSGGGMINVVDVPCGFADNLQVELALNKLIVTQLGAELKTNPTISLAEQKAFVDALMMNVRAGVYNDEISVLASDEGADGTLEKTARRELAEESGLKVDEDIKGNLFALVNVRGGSYHIGHFIYDYTDVDVGGFPQLKPQQDEGIKSCHWVAVEDIHFQAAEGNGGVTATVELAGKQYHFKGFDQIPFLLASAIEYQGLNPNGLNAPVTQFANHKAPMMVSDMNSRYQMPDPNNADDYHTEMPRVC